MERRRCSSIGDITGAKQSAFVQSAGAVKDDRSCAGILLVLMCQGNNVEVACKNQAVSKVVGSAVGSQSTASLAGQGLRQL
eukprot:15080228-Ditylum_brightwellii.AAC.1